MRTTLPNLIRGAIVALTAAAACLAAPSTTAHASTADLGYSLDALCPTMQLRVTVWNNTPNDEQLSIVLWTSLYTWTTSEITAKANQPNYVYFDVVAGERIDKIQYRDPQLNVVFNTFPGWVIDPNAPYCERKAVDHITVDNYQLSCVNGVLHATMDVINDGDYDHDMQALLAPQFDTQEQKDLAEQHGFGAAVDNFWLAAGDSHPVSLSHLVVEQFVVKVTTFTGPTHFADGPRALQGDELACQHDMSVVTGEQPPADTTPDTTPDTTQDTTPDTTQDTTPDTTPDTTQDTTADTSVPVSEESAGSPTAPTDAPTTSISRNLPSTGRGSGAVIMFAAVMATLGWLLVRTARRRPA